MEKLSKRARSLSIVLLVGLTSRRFLLAWREHRRNSTVYVIQYHFSSGDAGPCKKTMVERRRQKRMLSTQLALTFCTFFFVGRFGDYRQLELRSFQLSTHITPRGVRRKWGVTPKFSSCFPLVFTFVHYFLENYTREPPHYTRKGDTHAMRCR